MRSDAYNAINFRGRTALDVNSCVGTSTTFTLPENQWSVEAETMFLTSLARMQLNLYDFAMGTYADIPGVRNFVAENMENANRLIMFPVKGYKNLSAFWLWFTVGACTSLFFHSRRYSTAEQRNHLISQGQDPGYHDNLWGTIFWKLLKKFFLKICETLKPPAKVLWSFAVKMYEIFKLLKQKSC